MRVLSGIQPSGGLHLGNYFGMMKPMLEYQKTDDLFCFIVNYHALTSQRDPKELSARTREAACDFLALGLDPEKCVFWVQSDVPQVAELAWILSNVTGMGLLERCHSYKDKIAGGVKPSHGLFSYPVLMTADILIMQAEKIPVGADQKQHVEVAQDIAEKFNNTYGRFFKVPEPVIQEGGRMLPGTDGRKMSKSYGNTIEIFSDKDDLRRKISGFKTDSAPVGQAKRPDENSLYLLYSAFLDEAAAQNLRVRFESPGLKYSEIKSELIEFIWDYFKPFREARRPWAEDPGKVVRALVQGAEKARAIAEPTLREVRKRIGVEYTIYDV